MTSATEPFFRTRDLPTERGARDRRVAAVRCASKPSRERDGDGVRGPSRACALGVASVERRPEARR
jgi:hypothetical protein